MGRFPSLDARSRIASFQMRPISETEQIPTRIPLPGFSCRNFDHWIARTLWPIK